MFLAFVAPKCHIPGETPEPDFETVADEGVGLYSTVFSQTWCDISCPKADRDKGQGNIVRCKAGNGQLCNHLHTYRVTEALGETKSHGNKEKRFEFRMFSPLIGEWARFGVRSPDGSECASCDSYLASLECRMNGGPRQCGSLSAGQARNAQHLLNTVRQTPANLPDAVEEKD
jgi:hypothetical protein